MDRERPATNASGLRLAELVAALSLATDLGLGQPMMPFRISKTQRAAVLAFLDDRAWQSFIDAGMKPSIAKREASALLSRAAGLSRDAS